MTSNAGLTELYGGDVPVVEHVRKCPHLGKPAEAHSVVAVHRLNGDSPRIWTTEGSEKMWLKDLNLLPSNLKNSRILTNGYNANVTAMFSKTSSDRILQHAHTLVAQLVTDREASLVGKVESAMATKTEQIAGRCDPTAHNLRLPLTWWHWGATCKTEWPSRSQRLTFRRQWRIPQAAPASPFSICIRSTSRRSGFCSWGHLTTAATKPSSHRPVVA